MTFTQRYHDCDEHEDCTLIDCVTQDGVTDDGAVVHEPDSVVWRSHLHSDIHADCRANSDHPAKDHRGKKPVAANPTAEPCDECLAHPEWPRPTGA